MRIILTQNVPNLGALGDEVQVKDGYARNYLLPKGLALAAGGQSAKALEHKRHHLESIRKEAISQASSQAEQVAALDITIQVRAGTGGRLFGSVTNRDLQAALAEKGVEVDRKSIVLHTPVKSLGSFEASVKLHTEVKTDITFRVEPLGELVQPEPVEGEESTGESTEAGAEAGTETAAEAKAAPEASADAVAEAAAEAEPEEKAE